MEKQLGEKNEYENKRTQQQVSASAAMTLSELQTGKLSSVLKEDCLFHPIGWGVHAAVCTVCAVMPISPAAGVPHSAEGCFHYHVPVFWRIKS